jgi:3-dehydroquinate dehydratase-2
MKRLICVLSLALIAISAWADYPSRIFIDEQDRHVQGIAYDNVKNHLFLSFTTSFVIANHEGEIIDKLHAARLDKCGVILNAGAYTHYSYAIRDAISAIKIPVIEVHISNICAREEFRHNSVIAPVCSGSLFGFGKDGYLLALQALAYKTQN